MKHISHIFTLYIPIPQSTYKTVILNSFAILFCIMYIRNRGIHQLFRFYCFISKFVIFYNKNIIIPQNHYSQNLFLYYRISHMYHLFSINIFKEAEHILLQNIPSFLQSSYLRIYFQKVLFIRTLRYVMNIQFHSLHFM